MANQNQTSLPINVNTPEIACTVRVGVLDSIAKLVTGHKPVVINLVGPRWIGKTSVLKCLHPNRSPSLNELLYVYIDLKKDEAALPNPFVKIADEIYEALLKRPLVKVDHISAKQEKSAEKRLQTLGYLAKSNDIRMLICIDHLDKYLRDNKESVSLLRPLTILSESASLVLATKRTLTDISPDLAASPFVHKALILSLGLLEAEDALNLLQNPDREGDEIELSDKDKESLIKIVGRHPYLLARAGQQARELLRESPERQQKGITVNDIRARIEPTLRPVFEGLWQDHGELLTQYQMSQASHAAQTENDQSDQEREYEEIVARAIRQELQRAALIYEDPTNEFKFNYFSPLFESFVFQKVALAMPATETLPSRRMAIQEMLALLDIRQGTKEYELLHMLVDNAGAVIGDSQLQSTIWGDKVPERALVTTVGRLRSKLDQHQKEINGRLVRIRQQGYSFQWL